MKPSFRIYRHMRLGIPSTWCSSAMPAGTPAVWLLVRHKPVASAQKFPVRHRIGLLAPIVLLPYPLKPGLFTSQHLPSTLYMPGTENHEKIQYFIFLISEHYLNVLQFRFLFFLNWVHIQHFIVITFLLIYRSYLMVRN